MNFLQEAIPGEIIKIHDLKLTCAICGLTSLIMEAYGYTLPQTGEDIQSGRVRVVLKQVSSDSPLKCDCLLPQLQSFPVVGLYIPSDNPRFN